MTDETFKAYIRHFPNRTDATSAGSWSGWSLSRTSAGELAVKNTFRIIANRRRFTQAVTVSKRQLEQLVDADFDRPVTSMLVLAEALVTDRARGFDLRTKRTVDATTGGAQEA